MSENKEKSCQFAVDWMKMENYGEKIFSSMRLLSASIDKVIMEDPKRVQTQTFLLDRPKDFFFFIAASFKVKGG